jgi:hypothetical protein
LALIAEVFGDGAGHKGAAKAQRGRLVGGGHHHHGMGQAFFAELAFEELVDFAAAFPDEGDYVDLRRGMACHHAQQSALAHPRPGENAHALAFADG